MNGRTIFRVFAVLLAVGLAIGIGTMVYNAGVSAGLTEAAEQAVASGEPIPALPYGYGYGGPYVHGPFGFGVFGLIFGIFAIFLIIGLVRMAFGLGRWGGRAPGGWRGPGRPGPDGWRGGRHEKVEEWHRELHRRDEGSSAPPSGEQRAVGT